MPAIVQTLQQQESGQWSDLLLPILRRGKDFRLKMRITTLWGFRLDVFLVFESLSSIPWLFVTLSRSLFPCLVVESLEASTSAADLVREVPLQCQRQIGVQLQAQADVPWPQDQHVPGEGADIKQWGCWRRLVHHRQGKGG